MNKLLLKNCKSLLTLKEHENDITGALQGYSLLVEGEKIKKIDVYENLKDLVDEQTKVIDCSEKTVLPGFVDPHTHLVFGGDRLDEYSAKLTMTDPEEIKKNVKIGLTGLDSTIKQTKDAGFEGLYKEALEKLNTVLLNGTTTIEIKSGYGIDKEVELTQLRVIKELRDKVPQTLIATYLGGHDWDKSMGKDAYLDFMINEVMPVVKEEDLATMADIWVEDSIFSIDQGRKYLRAAKEFGLAGTIHGDELSGIGASKMAAEEGAYSVAHLNYITEEAIDAMIENSTVGIVLPTTDYVKQYDDRLADARHFVDRGMDVAIATNINPGDYTVSMTICMDLVCKRHRLTPAEALRAASLNAAKALRLDESYGSLEEGKFADIQIWDTDDYRNVVYRHGSNFVDTVIKHGKLVVEGRKLVY
ncbi:MAG: imidazolonepropionase [Bacillota bacterium]|nr:imidazolonepropionase [Bacillota bacterium]